jgi:hypothetical protein
VILRSCDSGALYSRVDGSRKVSTTLGRLSFASSKAGKHRNFEDFFGGMREAMSSN